MSHPSTSAWLSLRLSEAADSMSEEKVAAAFLEVGGWLRSPRRSCLGTPPYWLQPSFSSSAAKIWREGVGNRPGGIGSCHIQFGSLTNRAEPVVVDRVSGLASQRGGRGFKSRQAPQIAQVKGVSTRSRCCRASGFALRRGAAVTQRDFETTSHEGGGHGSRYSY